MQWGSPTSTPEQGGQVPVTARGVPHGDVIRRHPPPRSPAPAHTPSLITT